VTYGWSAGVFDDSIDARDDSNIEIAFAHAAEA
jgi:hypothetical protein